MAEILFNVDHFIIAAKRRGLCQRNLNQGLTLECSSKYLVNLIYVPYVYFIRNVVILIAICNVEDRFFFDSPLSLTPGILP